MTGAGLPKATSLREIVIIFCVCILFGSVAVWCNPYHLDWSRGELSHQIAYNLYRTGHMYGGVPFLARPPGYIYFVAFVFSIADQLARLGAAVGPTAADLITKTDLLKAVFVAQVIVHALNAVVLYLWAGRLMHRRIALFIALCFGTSIYWLVQLASVHYAVWHLFLVLAGGYLWTRAWLDRGNSMPAFLSGLLWGCATLVRPVTLMLPLFAVPAAFLSSPPDRRWVLRFSLLFVLGMFLVIGPHTFQNYRQTGRLIFVNAQAGVALWSGSQPHPGISPNKYFWATLFPDFEKIYQDTTGEAYTFDGYIRHNLELEDEFKRRAWLNVRNQPGTYVKNIIVNLKDFAVGVDSAYITQFLSRKYAKKYEDLPAHGRPAMARELWPYKGLIIFMTVLTGLAVYFAANARYSLMVIPAAVLFCYGLGHALTLLDIHYYYFKQPFLYLGAGYVISRLCYAADRSGPAWRITGFSMLTVVACLTILGWRLLF